MPSSPFSHIDQRVTHLAEASPFYTAFLVAIGFSDHVEEVSDPAGAPWRVFTFRQDAEPNRYFGIVEDANHVPNRNAVAFQADSRGDVDRLAEIARTAGAVDIEGPMLCPEYSPTYYAVFFKDPCGNRLEVCHMG